MVSSTINSLRKPSRLVFAVAVVALGGLLSTIVVYRNVRAAISFMAERKQTGFVVKAGGVVYRTPNSELRAPAWDEPVTQADPATFKTIHHSNQFCLGADAQTVFMGEGKRVYRLSNSQASTFRLLTPDGRYACDAQQVYYLGFPLPNADPTSFKILGNFTAKDAQQVYVGPLVLAGAAPESFELESEGTLPPLTTTYSEGPCTERKFHDKGIHVKEFRARDRHKRFGGAIGSQF